MSAATAEANGTTQDEVTQGATPQPLFFKTPHPITPERHASAGLRKGAGFAYAQETNSIMLTINDIPEAARSYPIVFSSDENAPHPVALLGLGKENRFVSQDGQWDPMHYIPAYIRRYPFGLAPVPNADDMALCIDESAPHFASENAELPFFEDGKPSKLTQDALQFCGSFQKQSEDTIAFGKALKEADLLSLQNLEIKGSDGSKRVIENVQIIHKERWHNFAQNHANEWEQKGYLAMVVMILASQANWKYLALRG